MRLLLAMLLALATSCGEDSSTPGAARQAPSADRSRNAEPAAEAVRVAKVAKSQTVDTSGWQHRTLRVLGMT